MADYRLHTTPTESEKSAVIIEFLSTDTPLVLKSWDILIPVYTKMIATASSWNINDQKYNKGVALFNAASAAIGDIEAFYEAIVKFLFWVKDNIK